MDKGALVTVTALTAALATTIMALLTNYPIALAPGMGIIEDEATGSAAIGLTSLKRRGLDITQGRGSRIRTTWASDGWATIGGRVVEEQPRVLPQ